MRTFNERTDGVMNRIQKKYRKRTVSRITALVCVAALALALFLPFSTEPPSVRQYRSSPYYDLIQKINKATYTPPSAKNNFQRLFQSIEDLVARPGELTMGGILQAPTADAPNDGTGSYREVTDNQVQGVIEGDLVKRTDSHIFYLRRETLSVYTIAQAESGLAGEYRISVSGDAVSLYDKGREMYLSADGNTVTLVLPGFGDALTQGKKEAFVCVISLDVSDPEVISEKGRIFLTGGYLSSRLTEGKLLVMSQFAISQNYRFDQPETYLPRIGTPGDLQPVAAEDIIAPESLSGTQYTVVAMLDLHALSVMDTAAFLSYSQELYVSRENIFATRGFVENTKDGDRTCSRAMTQITCLGYTEDGFSQKGSVTVEGAVKNQYSMDEYQQILRVVTSTTRNVDEYRVSGDWAHSVRLESARNVNLYCISMTDWTVAACVEAFAPEGETAESVRFDGTTAYVCTAEVITLTDPVYYFDLSDLKNITWKDTGTIDGYSSSLVNFGDHLLGIGYNDTRCLKIEVYRETQTGVESAAAYERDCLFSEEYKSYLIDREDQIIGIGIKDPHAVGRYILLQFDGYQLRLLADIPLDGSNATKRGILIDGWLYLLAEQDQFKTERIW